MKQNMKQQLQALSINTILLSFFFMACNSRGVDCKYIIPKGYVGPVVIMFDDKNGEAEKYDNGMRVYQIPLNGVLKTKFTENRKPHKVLFYYNEDGILKQIPVVMFSDSLILNKEKTDTIICGLENGEDYYQNTPQIFETFIIAPYNRTDSVSNLNSKFLWHAMPSKSSN